MASPLSDQPASNPPEFPSLVVVLLGDESNKFHPSYIEQGESGGHSAARKIHRVVEGEIGEGETKVVVYLVAESSGKSNEEYERFLAGFSSSTSKLSLVVSPCGGESGSVERIVQLLSFYVRLPFVSKCFVAPGNKSPIIDHLLAISTAQRTKVILFDAGKTDLRLIDGGFDVLRIDEGLFNSAAGTVNGSEGTAGVSSVAASGGEGAEDDATESINSTSPTSLSRTFEASDASPPSRRPRPNARFRPSAQYPRPAPVPPGPFEVPRIRFGSDKPCRDYYLYKGGCKKGRNCRYLHNYPFTSAEWAAYPRLIKSIICPWARDGDCRWGEDCYMGHRCPYTETNCRFGETCKFRLAGLPHSELQFGQGWGAATSF